MKQLKIGTHIIFDEANMLLPASQLPSASVALPKSSYCSETQDNTANENPKLNHPAKLKVQLLSLHAKPPRRATSQAAGNDLTAPSRSHSNSLWFSLFQLIYLSNALLIPMPKLHLVAVWSVSRHH